MIVVTIDAQTGKVIGEPELVTRGVVFGAESDELLERRDAPASPRRSPRRRARARPTSGVIKNALRESLSQFMWESLRRRPMIIPIVMEV